MFVCLLVCLFGCSFVQWEYLSLFCNLILILILILNLIFMLRIIQSTSLSTLPAHILTSYIFKTAFYRKAEN